MSSRSRIVSRDGKVQICLDRVSFGKRQRYWRNPLTTLLNLKWRWIVLVFSISFIITWTLFACVYYAIADAYGDMVHVDDPGHTPCVRNLKSFTSAFLFSLETQHTIGFGYRNPTSKCGEVVFVIYVQYIIGVAVQCITAGLVMAKLQSGTRTCKAILFSDKACVGMCHGKVCLMIRIGNAGGSELANIKGFGILIEKHRLETGEEILTESIKNFASENGNEHLNLLWPAVIHCAIVETPIDFLRKIQRRNIELIIVIEGVLEATGQNIQLRSSYLAHEIEIGKQFVDISPRMVCNQGANGYYHSVDYDEFNIMEHDNEWDFAFWSPYKYYSKMIDCY